MKFLGIDYGKNKIGLAISDGQTADPWQVIQISGLKDAVVRIIQIVKKAQIEAIVIGKPESGESAVITKKFLDSLKKETAITIITEEETLTTQNAKQKMIELGLSKKRRQREDSFSASLILQNYLDRRG